MLAIAFKQGLMKPIRPQVFGALLILGILAALALIKEADAHIITLILGGITGISGTLISLDKDKE